MRCDRAGKAGRAAVLCQTLVIMILLNLLVGCGPVPQPFRQDAETKARATLARATITSGVRLLPVAGLLPEHGAALSEAMADKLRKLGTAATTSEAMRHAYFLSPNAFPDRADPSGSWIIRWDLFDPDGVLRDTIVTPAPSDAQLDALLTGRKKSLRSMIETIAVQMHTTVNPRSSAPVLERTANLAVGEIAGAPGNGAADLSRAATAIFSRAGIAMADGSESADLVLNAEVTVTPIDDTSDLLKLAWTLEDVDGRRVGRLVQESPVAKGTLDGDWRGLAYDAVFGLVDAIHEVQEAYRQGA